MNQHLWGIVPASWSMQWRIKAALSLLASVTNKVASEVMPTHWPVAAGLVRCTHESLPTMVSLFQTQTHWGLSCIFYQSLSQYPVSQLFDRAFFNWGRTKICRTRTEWGTANGLQAGLGRNMVMEKVTIQVRPTETFTARLDGNVFISVSNSSRDYFMGGRKTKCEKYIATGQRGFNFQWSWCDQELSLSISQQNMLFLSRVISRSTWAELQYFGCS